MSFNWSNQFEQKPFNFFIVSFHWIIVWNLFCDLFYKRDLLKSRETTITISLFGSRDSGLKMMIKSKTFWLELQVLKNMLKFKMKTPCSICVTCLVHCTTSWSHSALSVWYWTEMQDGTRRGKEYEPKWNEMKMINCFSFVWRLEVRDSEHSVNHLSVSSLHVCFDGYFLPLFS